MSKKTLLTGSNLKSDGLFVAKKNKKKETRRKKKETRGKRRDTKIWQNKKCFIRGKETDYPIYWKQYNLWRTEYFYQRKKETEERAKNWEKQNIIRKRKEYCSRKNAFNFKSDGLGSFIK